jgi:hypothetical protein
MNPNLEYTPKSEPGFPKWIYAPEGWTPGGHPFRESHRDRSGKLSVVVQDEQDEQEILKEASK